LHSGPFQFSVTVRLRQAHGSFTSFMVTGRLRYLSNAPFTTSYVYRNLTTRTPFQFACSGYVHEVIKTRFRMKIYYKFKYLIGVIRIECVKNIIAKHYSVIEHILQMRYRYLYQCLINTENRTWWLIFNQEN